MTEKDSKAKREANYKRHGSRYRARRRAVDLIFEAEQRGIDINKLVDERLDMARDPESDVNPVPEYAETIARGVAAELVTIDETIKSYLSDEWPLRRIPAVDRAILRLSTWELFFNPDVPPRVAVVEGVELASEYSTDVAPPYINAVLDAEAEIADQARLAAAAVSSIVVDIPGNEAEATAPAVGAEISESENSESAAE